MSFTKCPKVLKEVLKICAINSWSLWHSFSHILVAVCGYCWL